MKFMDEVDNFRYILWILTIVFAALVLWGPRPEDGSLYPTAVMSLILFGSLLVIYLILKFIQKKKYGDKNAN